MLNDTIAKNFIISVLQGSLNKYFNHFISKLETVDCW